MRNCTSPDYGMLVSQLKSSFYCLRVLSSFSTSRCTRACTCNAWNMASAANQGETHPRRKCWVPTAAMQTMTSSHALARSRCRRQAEEKKHCSQRYQGFEEFQSAKPKSPPPTRWYVFHCSWNNRATKQCARRHNQPQRSGGCSKLGLIAGSQLLLWP